MQKVLLKLILIAAIIASYMVAVIYIQNKNNYVIDQFVQAVEANDFDKMKELFLMDEAIKLDEISLNNFLQYLHTNEEKLQFIEKSLSEQMDREGSDANTAVQLHVKEKRYGLIPTYQLQLQPTYLHIENVDEESLEVKWDHGIVINKHPDKPIYGPLFPGEHLIHIQFENDLGMFQFQEEITVWDEKSLSINVVEEEVVTEDEHIREKLFEISALFSKLFIEYSINNDLHDELLSNWNDRLTQSIRRYSEVIDQDERLNFVQAIFDEESFGVMKIDERWHAELRLISTYEKQSNNNEQEHLLFTIDFIYDEFIDEWVINNFALDYTEQSIIDLWDSSIHIDREDLNNNQLELTL